MSEPLSPEEITQNELICEKLLGWRLLGRSGSCDTVWSLPNGRDGRQGTPSFTTWAEAGLILDALVKAGQRPDVSYYDRWYSFVDANCREGDEFPDAHDTGPLAIRAAALQYIRSLP